MEAIAVIGEENVWCVGREGVIIKYISHTTPVNDYNDIIPQNIELEQNFPNPFNSSTKIKFSLKERGKVKLTVYDITGRKISILVSEELAQGKYSFVWKGKNGVNGSNVASGIYIYELKTDMFPVHKKMLLIR